MWPAQGSEGGESLENCDQRLDPNSPQAGITKSASLGDDTSARCVYASRLESLNWVEGADRCTRSCGANERGQQYQKDA